MLYARLLHGDKPLNIFNAHVSRVDEQNADNIRETIAYVRRFPGDRILAGDFNVKPDALTALREHGWIDAWIDFGPGTQDYFRSRESRDEERLHLGEQNRLTRVCDRSIIADSGDANGVRASDHHGLLVELE